MNYALNLKISCMNVTGSAFAREAYVKAFTRAMSAPRTVDAIDGSIIKKTVAMALAAPTSMIAADSRVTSAFLKALARKITAAASEYGVMPSYHSKHFAVWNEVNELAAEIGSRRYQESEVNNALVKRVAVAMKNSINVMLEHRFGADYQADHNRVDREMEIAKMCDAFYQDFAQVLNAEECSA